MHDPAAVTVEEVCGARALREFVFLPERLYRDDPLWRPPLWADEKATFTPRNPVLAHSDYRLLLARRGGTACGRLIAHMDHNFTRFTGTRTGFVGSFECTDDYAVSTALLRAADRWLERAGMDRVRGPINPVSEQWGLLLRGHESPPVFMAPYNPPFYNDQFARCGYAKVKDLLAFEVDVAQGYTIPPRFERFRALMRRRRPRYTVRRLDLGRLRSEAEHIWRITNEAVRDNWGYVPLDRAELETMLRRLKPVASPDAVWMVEDSGTPVGYALGFPDLNILLERMRGRLFPFGFVTLLRGLAGLRDYRLFGLAVLPAYHNLGLDVLLYMSLYEALAPKGIRLEANYILEDNLKIRNALEKLGMKQTKVYRVYEKPLAVSAPA
jgi:GNAT superfamily N-acetyltransferase